MTVVLKRILIGFFSLLLVSVVVYTLLEVTAINETEEEVTEVYQDQLSAILFSVNQYSQDVLGSWIKAMTPANSALAGDEQENALEFLIDHPSIQLIFSVDTALVKYWFSGKIPMKEAQQVQEMLSNNEPLINRLIQYLGADYQKLEPLLDAESRSYLIYISNQNGAPLINGFRIDPAIFISEILAPRLQVVAREEIILSAYAKAQDTVIYTTRPDQLNQNEMITSAASSLWLFPTHYLGVSFMDRTLNDLVQERTRNNIIMLVIINLVLIVGVFLIIRNVNKQMRLAKMKSDFVSNVSHEIRTPLALISMYAETLEMNRVKNDEERNHFYHIILGETKRLTGLVNRILKFSKLEAGKQSYNFQPANLNDTVNEVVSSFEFHLQEGGFELSFEEIELPYINLDREAISTAIFNLLDNAIKYSGDSKKIDISTGILDEEVFVYVKDYGIGIPAKDQRRIFEKFYRVEDPLVHNTKGSGLGLNLVHQIIADHGGRITLESSENNGTSFKLFFQLTKQEHESNISS